MSFLGFYPSSNWERESGKRNLGIKEKCPQSYLSYFRRGSTGESFFFYGLIDFSVFNTDLKDLESFVSQLIFYLQPGVKWLWFVCPLWTLLKNWPSSYLLPLRGREPHFRFGVPANHLASLSFPFWCPVIWGHEVRTPGLPCVTHIPS